MLSNSRCDDEFAVAPPGHTIRSLSLKGERLIWIWKEFAYGNESVKRYKGSSNYR